MSSPGRHTNRQPSGSHSATHGAPGPGRTPGLGHRAHGAGPRQHCLLWAAALRRDGGNFVYGPQRPCCLPAATSPVWGGGRPTIHLPRPPHQQTAIGVPPRLGRGLPRASCVLPRPPYQQAATGFTPSSSAPSALGTGPLDPGTAPKAASSPPPPPRPPHQQTAIGVPPRLGGGGGCSTATGRPHPPWGLRPPSALGWSGTEAPGRHLILDGPQRGPRHHVLGRRKVRDTDTKSWRGQGCRLPGTHSQTATPGWPRPAPLWLPHGQRRGWGTRPRSNAAPQGVAHATSQQRCPPGGGARDLAATLPPRGWGTRPRSNAAPQGVGHATSQQRCPPGGEARDLAATLPPRGWGTRPRSNAAPQAAC